MVHKIHMLFGNEQLYSLVRSAKLGEVGLPLVLAELRDWIQDNLGVSIVHIVFDHIEFGPSAGRPRLNMILETDADYDSWKGDAVTIQPDIERRVLSQFRELVGNNSGTDDIDDILLILDNFSDECLGRACSAFLEADADRIVKDFAAVPIWRIDGFSRYLVVFLNTDRDIHRRASDGTCAEVSRCCFNAVRCYDEFDYLSDTSFRLKFDSKENLDKNYNGNLFYYWR